MVDGPAAQHIPLPVKIALGLLVLFAMGVLVMPAAHPLPSETYRVVHEYPHDPAAFTQGLVYRDRYESTGITGRSTLRKVDLDTGRVLQEVKVPDRFFAEGLTDWRHHLIQLTWQAHSGFVYDLASFAKLDEFSYPTEGWGLTHDDSHLILSDGSSVLRYLDPATFETVRTLRVTAGNGPVKNLNELEYIEGEIYANIWETDLIARISPDSGKVLDFIDLTGLLPDRDRTAETNVLNGIAYDSQNKRIFVTGKFWPKLFEIQILDRQKSN
jgi:glutamine cyclotransferase